MPMPIETRANLVANDIRQILMSYPAIAKAIASVDVNGADIEHRIQVVIAAALSDVIP
jgi:hypothetical protein